MNYYFLAASLPALSLDAPPPLSSAAFLKLCGEHLTPEDRRTLAALDAPLTEASAHPFVREWRKRETFLRNAAARARAERLKRDAAPYLHPQPDADPSTERAVADAFARGDPAERERRLDRWRWQQLEDLAGFNPFAARALFAYALKLRLAERWARMNDAEGARRAEEIVATPPGRGPAEQS